VTLPFVGERKRTFERRWSNVCWNGNGIAGPTFATAQISGQDLQIVFNSSSSDWAWGQCAVEGPGFAAMLIAAVVVGLCVLCCAVRWVWRCACGRPHAERGRSGMV